MKQETRNTVVLILTAVLITIIVHLGTRSQSPPVPDRFLKLMETNNQLIERNNALFETNNQLFKNNNAIIKDYVKVMKQLNERIH